ncbi:hypothetical protein BN381_400002 [Candidatus Microthrix parvicella RN1]|uniref:Uncharacterized protein n=1 Tax=Candidatus Neomicrothrix parvicella RN1 TaxID=1229780 RepID=R4Z0N4_9ACTN|nr:hypothetical protein BN381_400002 [Candidatus Microthrix parvicella RN1]
MSTVAESWAFKGNS